MPTMRSREVTGTSRAVQVKWAEDVRVKRGTDGDISINQNGNLILLDERMAYAVIQALFEVAKPE